MKNGGEKIKKIGVSVFLSAFFCLKKNTGLLTSRILIYEYIIVY